MLRGLEAFAVVGCAQDDPPYVLDWDLSFLHWPSCPLREETQKF